MWEVAADSRRETIPWGRGRGQTVALDLSKYSRGWNIRIGWGRALWRLTARRVLGVWNHDTAWSEIGELSTPGTEQWEMRFLIKEIFFWGVGEVNSGLEAESPIDLFNHSNSILSVFTRNHLPQAERISS